MAVLSIYLSGVSTTGIELATEAARQAFGECNVEELNKENLRFKIRTGSKDASVVLIVLDDTSVAECADIENGLFDSDKFYNYKNDKDFVSFLNREFELNLDVPNDLLEVSVNTGQSGIQKDDESISEIIEKYQGQLDDRDSIIRTLNSTISELNSILYGEGYATNTKEVEEYKAKNLDLLSQLSDIQSQLDKVNSLLAGKETKNVELSEEVDRLADRVASYEATIKELNAELANERSVSSQKSGVIRDKDREIDKLRARVSGIEGSTDKVRTLEVEVLDLKAKMSALQTTIRTLEADNTTKADEIERLKRELETEGKLSEQALRYQEALESAKADKTQLQKQLFELQEGYNTLADKHDGLVDELNDYDVRFEELEGKLAQSEEYLTRANKDNLDLREQVRVLKDSVGANGAEKALSELSEVKKKYLLLQNSVFNMLGNKALPRSGVKVPLMSEPVGKIKNIRFQFSGSAESRKGTYKCIYNEFASATKERFLIVDVTSETAIDYVFGIKKVVDGVPWFTSGGGVQRYLSSTCLPNVKVLMPQLGYINDGYFLTIDWVKRLKELENSGYRVVVYCGDISNMIGRVLFENFVTIANTAIYVQGNALGSRSIIANTSGLSGIKKAFVAYYNFDKKMSNFYSIMEKRCKCKVLSYAQRQ